MKENYIIGKSGNVIPVIRVKKPKKETKVDYEKKQVGGLQNKPCPIRHR